LAVYVIVSMMHGHTNNILALFDVLLTHSARQGSLVIEPFCKTHTTNSTTCPLSLVVVDSVQIYGNPLQYLVRRRTDANFSTITETSP